MKKAITMLAVACMAMGAPYTIDSSLGIGFAAHA